MKTTMLIYLALLLSASCNDNKKNKDATTNASPATSDTSTTPIAPASPETVIAEIIDSEEPVPTPPKPKEPVKPPAGEYRVVISFISQASGVDRELHKKFKELLATYTPTVTPDITPWGREGEVDYCMKLNELTVKQQKNFIQQVRDIMGNTDMVFIKENAQCVHKR